MSGFVAFALGMSGLLLGIRCQIRADAQSRLEQARRHRVLRELARREEAE